MNKKNNNKTQDLDFPRTAIPRENRKKFKLFNVKKDGIDFKLINSSIFLMSILAAIVLSIFAFTMVRDIVLQPFRSFIVILTPFIIGFVIAWLFTPLVEKLQEYRKISRRKASAIVSVTGILLITLMILGILYASVDTLLTFLSGNNLLHYIGNVDSDIAGDIVSNLKENKDNQAMQLIIFLLEQLGWLTVDGDDYTLITNIDNIDQYIGVVLTFTYQYVIIAIVAAFLLPEFRGLSNMFKGIVPKKYKSQGSDLIDIVAKAFTNYMNGALKIATLVATFVGVGLIVISLLSNTFLAHTVQGGAFYLGTNHIVTIILMIMVFTILIGVTNLVPYIGPFFGGIPVILLVFLTDKSDGFWITIAVASLIITIQSLESVFFQPTIMGKSTKIHPVVILMGLTIFSYWFGLVGFLISTPIIAVLKAIIMYFDDIYEIF